MANIVPGFVELPNETKQLPMHFHTPRTGGELIWNNIQLISVLNSHIATLNKAVPPQIKYETDTINHIPYVTTPANPTIGFNTHHHTSEFDGGTVFGAGLHDHRDNANGGFSYCVYHPGTGLPKLAYEKEEVQPLV